MADGTVDDEVAGPIGRHHGAAQDDEGGMAEHRKNAVVGASH